MATKNQTTKTTKTKTTKPKSAKPKSAKTKTVELVTLRELCIQLNADHKRGKSMRDRFRAYARKNPESEFAQIHAHGAGYVFPVGGDAHKIASDIIRRMPEPKQ